MYVGHAYKCEIKFNLWYLTVFTIKFGISFLFRLTTSNLLDNLGKPSSNLPLEVTDTFYIYFVKVSEGISKYLFKFSETYLK